MAKKREERSSGGRDLQTRLKALAGLVVIVGSAAAILFAAGVLGGQGGGTTETGIEIENVELVETPPVGDLDVAAREGSLAPDFVISDFDGSRHRLSDFRGTPVFVNFWATWCIPCQRELPDVQELADRHQDDLVVISINRAEPLDRAEAFLSNIEKLNGEPGISFTVDGLDPSEGLYQKYAPIPGVMPVSYFLDANGKVIKLYGGLISLEMMEESLAEAVASAGASESGPSDAGS